MAPKDFHHPYEPYDIQQELMQSIYDCIEDGKVGIFESPTGTGKSLSLICASLTWLREHKRRTFEDALNSVQIDDEDPEWMIEHAREERRKEIRHLRADLEARLEAVRRREQKMRERNANGEPPPKRRRQVADGDAGRVSDDEQFVLGDYESEDDEKSAKRLESDYSSETTKMMQKLGMLQQHQDSSAGEAVEEELKIFFCSRTHSQLSQFVGELQRVKLPPGLPPESDERALFEDPKHLTLGSRKNLCINPKVLKLGNQTAINERCVELQQIRTPADHKCPFLPKKENEDTVLDFRDHVLAKIRDIEDLATVGSKLGICPYYASRPTIGPAEIVTLPYPLLLQTPAREALGISLQGHVVIIDEAHNLIDAVEGIHSAQISSSQLTDARQCLMVYLQRFRSRLKGSNRAYVTQLIRVIDSLLGFAIRLKEKRESAGTVEPAVLLSGKGADQVNITKLARYVSDSKLALKVDGYNAHLQAAEAPNGGRERSSTVSETPTLTLVANFLVPLMNPSKEGKFFWECEKDVVTLRYMLLDPSEHFRDIVENARAVILAGGTMSPMEDYKQQLFPYVAGLRTTSCGHLIAPSNLLVRTVAADEHGPLEFSFQARNNTDSAARIGSALQMLAPTVRRGGLVVFFPSYTFLEEVLTAWRSSGTYSTLQSIKPLFTDSRTGTTIAEEAFSAYRAAISTNPTRGAMLLSVIGGKLSEGINFSDDLGRLVLVVGLPFPNLRTPEWKAKLEYIEAKALARRARSDEAGSDGAAEGYVKGSAGREHAENVCMRAVNQAVGRVIRHQGDWAGIVLMDARFARSGIAGKLPGWIRASVPRAVGGRDTQLSRVVGDVKGFFGTKASR